MTNLEDGDYTFVVTSTRPSGKQATEQVTVTIDTTAPTVTITSLADGMTSSQTAPTITGTADPGATVEVTILDENGDIIETLTTTADANGDFSVDASDLGDGTYTVEVTATDEAGNQGSAGPNTLIIDTEAPEVTITSPMMGEELDDSTPTITGTGEPGSTVEVLVDGEKVGEVVVDENGDWSFTVETELSTGEHTIEATTTDEAGNTGSTGEVTIIIGGSGTTVTNPTPGGEVTGPDVTVNGTGTPGDTITVTIGDRTETVTVDENGDWSVTVTDVPEGDATIVVTDGSGQTTEVEVTVVYPVDVEDNQYLLVGGCSSAQGGQPTAPVELLLVGLGLVALRRRRAA
jgi:MYXO-CTERM domain-containing protein